jgi:hypothetical protein
LLAVSRASGDTAERLARSFLLAVAIAIGIVIDHARVDTDSDTDADTDPDYISLIRIDQIIFFGQRRRLA